LDGCRQSKTAKTKSSFSVAPVSRDHYIIDVGMLPIPFDLDFFKTRKSDIIGWYDREVRTRDKYVMDHASKSGTGLIEWYGGQLGRRFE